jgi:periplasmic divalent cation tolerance protein
MTGKRLVLTTAGSSEEAHRIARELVDQHLAACVSIVSGVESVYRWQEKTEQAQEWLLVIKTRDAAFERLREAIEKLHSYKTPEIISVTIDAGSDTYLRWIDESVR